MGCETAGSWVARRLAGFAAFQGGRVNARSTAAPAARMSGEPVVALQPRWRTALPVSWGSTDAWERTPLNDGDPRTNQCRVFLKPFKKS